MIKSLVAQFTSAARVKPLRLLYSRTSTRFLCISLKTIHGLNVSSNSNLKRYTKIYIYRCICMMIMQILNPTGLSGPDLHPFLPHIFYIQAFS